MLPSDVSNMSQCVSVRVSVCVCVHTLFFGSITAVWFGQVLVFISGVDASGWSGKATGNTHHNKLSAITALPPSGSVCVCLCVS